MSAVHRLLFLIAESKTSFHVWRNRARLLAAQRVKALFGCCLHPSPVTSLLPRLHCWLILKHYVPLVSRA